MDPLRMRITAGRPERISVTLLCGSFNLGGSERNVVKIATGLDPTRFAIHVIALTGNGPLREPLEARGIPVDVADWTFDPRRFQDDFARLIALVRSVKPQVLHVFTYPTVYIGVAAAVLAEVPVRMVAIQAQDTWKGWIEWTMDRLIRPAVSLYLADSEGAGRFALRQQALPPARVRVLYDGPDPEELVPSASPSTLRARLGLWPDRPAVGVVARLHDEHKGQSTFLRSIARIPEVLGAQFVLVGGGQDEGVLRRLAEELELGERVRFLGPQPLGDALHALDVLVIPSRRFESVPKVLVEGMFTGRPIVASRVGDIPELLTDGVTGLLVPPEDPVALARAVSRLLIEPGLAQRLGQQAQVSLLERHITLSDTLALLGDLYQEMWSRGRAPGRRLRRRMGWAGEIYQQLRLADERIRWLVGWQ